MKLTQNIRCNVCKAPISFKWLFLSRRTQKYTCPVCKTEYEWNQSAARMDLTSLFFGIVAIMYINARYNYMPAVLRYTIGALIMVAILVGFTLFTPNQFVTRPKK